VIITKPVVKIATIKLLINERPIGIFATIALKFASVI